MQQYLGKMGERKCGASSKTLFPTRWNKKFKCCEYAMIIIIIVIISSLKCAEPCYTLNLPEEDTFVNNTDCVPASDQSSCTTDSETKGVMVTVLLPYKTRYKASLQRVAPAIYLGFKKVREMNLLPNYQIMLSYKNSNCSNVLAPLSFVDDVFHERANVFFGPSCELTLGKYDFKQTTINLISL